jgi:hypothetical protein
MVTYATRMNFFGVGDGPPSRVNIRSRKDINHVYRMKMVLDLATMTTSAGKEIVLQSRLAPWIQSQGSFDAELIGMYEYPL